VSVDAPPRPPEQDELDALIEEARRRARWRRFGYAAVVVGVLAAAGALYLGLGGGGGADGGATLRGDASPGGSAGHGSARPASASREDVYQRRCPGRGLRARPLTGTADQAARGITERRVGSSPQITTTVRPAMHAGARGSEVANMCGPRIARRTLVVFTWNHHFDHGPNQSASLAQHAFLVSRFAEGYRLWYWEH
jgi:hypothetical protein